jgi:uncharacterized protein YecT (DUF1311 family)
MRTVGLLVVSLGIMGVAASGQQVTAPATQLSSTQAADAELRSAEAEMMSILEALRSTAAQKPAALIMLDAAQGAWAKYRDAQLAAEWPSPSQAEYGSVLSMCVATERTRLTKLRTAELRATLMKADEPDVCSPAWPD